MYRDLFITELFVKFGICLLISGQEFTSMNNKFTDLNLKIISNVYITYATNSNTIWFLKIKTIKNKTKDVISWITGHIRNI